MDKLIQLKADVFGKQKTLAGIYYASGKQELYNYVLGWQAPECSNESASLAKLAEELLLQIYPAEVAKEACRQLAAQPIVSTIDHHGVLNHPFFINSNLIFSLKKDLKYLICFSTAGVSLNNSSWPGSLLVTLPSGKTKRLSFFTDKIKTQSVFSAPAFTPKNTSKLLTQIAQAAEILPKEKEGIAKLVNEITAESKAYSLKNFSSQASVLSSLLWEKIFPSAPKVIYLPVEDLVAQLIIKQISVDQKHALHKLFFTQTGWEFIEKYFTGQMGAFTSKVKGSFLFWAVGKNGRRLHLVRQGSEIKNQDYTGLKLSPEAVSKALELKQIYPSSLVCFLVLLYYGITCVGGFNQVNWLTGIKEKFLEALAEMGDSHSIARIKNISTQNFAEGNLAFLPSNKGFIKATGVDLYLTGRDYYPDYQKLAQSLTVGESIESLLPEIYRVIVPSVERKAGLLELDDADITVENGMAEKIRNIVK